jgi:hypothetical protein
MSPAMFCLNPIRRFTVLGVVFVAIGLQAPGFLPVGVVFLLLAVIRRYQRQRYQRGRC